MNDPLARIWQAAVDAVTSPDFRDEDGVLNEAAYLRYQHNAIAAARADLGLAPGEKQPVSDQEEQAASLWAELDRDEAAAEAAYAGPWQVRVVEPSTLAVGDTADVVAADQTRQGWAIATDHEGFGACSIPNATHIARHDPARVLREVRARRMRLGILLDELEDGRLAPPSEASREAFRAGVKALAAVMLDLEGMPYRDQPEAPEADT